MSPLPVREGVKTGEGLKEGVGSVVRHHGDVEEGAGTRGENGLVGFPGRITLLD